MFKRLGGGLHVFLVVLCACVLGLFITGIMWPVALDAQPKPIVQELVVKPAIPRVIYHQTFGLLSQANDYVGQLTRQGCSNITVSGTTEHGYGYWIVIGYKY